MVRMIVFAMEVHGDGDRFRDKQRGYFVVVVVVVVVVVGVTCCTFR